MCFDGASGDKVIYHMTVKTMSLVILSLLIITIDVRY